MMMCEKVRAVMFVPALMLAAACGKQQEVSRSKPTNVSASGVQKWKQDAKDAVTTTTAYLIQQKEQLQKSLGDKMTEFNHQLSDLKAKSEQTSERARSGWTNTFAELQEKKQAAADKLEQLKSSSTDKWQDFKAGAEQAFADLERALKDAFAHSNEDNPSSGP